MYKIAKPKFKFEIFLNDSKVANFHKSNQQRVVCFADSYEVSSDGSITFYQTALFNVNNEEKRLKIPVHSYANGKWEAISLLDDNNHYVIFSYRGSTNNNLVSEINDSNVNQETYTENPGPVHSRGHSYPTHFSSPSTMPGISSNPQEFKNLKNEWLEKNIKEYVKANDIFTVSKFLTSIKNDPQLKQFKPTEDDINWCASGLLREKKVVARKFSDINTQKTLSLILPDIMKRQWQGKMSPILEVLQDKEETKNTSAVDLSVWMINNNVV